MCYSEMKNLPNNDCKSLTTWMFYTLQRNSSQCRHNIVVFWEAEARTSDINSKKTSAEASIQSLLTHLDNKHQNGQNKDINMGTTIKI
jgi:hypothetical protein